MDSCQLFKHNLPDLLTTRGRQMDKVRLILKTFRVPLFLFAFSALSYGLLIPWLGFYWDDWPLVWNAHTFGPQVLKGLAYFRPASGWIYYFSFQVAGESPLAWHLYGLLWRWLSALTFWWLLSLLWPRRNRMAGIAALLFLIYPGFSQQSISVTYSVYFLYYTFFLASLCLMVLALRTSGRRWIYVGGSIVLGLISMLSTEYFYGLEFLRIGIIWAALKEKNSSARRKRAFREWVLYAWMIPVVFIWRYWASVQLDTLYRASLLEGLSANPASSLLELIRTIVIDLIEAGVVAFLRVAKVWNQLQVGSRVSWIYVLVVFAGVVLTVAMLRKRDKKEGDQQEPRQAIGLGAAALAISGLSFWITELPMRLAFPFDRFTLPMMFGACLLLAGAWTLLAVKSRLKLSLLALLVGLSAGFHFLMANEYRVDWELQAEFFRQLAWRVPDLQPGTALITPELTALDHYTDNSLTAPLNWMYSSELEPTRLTYAFFYADLRELTRLRRLTQGGVIVQGYDFVRFEGTAQNVLLVLYQPPACLKVLDPITDAHFPQLSAEVADLLQLSNPGLIVDRSNAIGERMTFWSFEPMESWCYYFERAELAASSEDWETVVETGEVALSLSDSPNQPGERVPFIEGYAMTGQWDRALELTKESFRINRFMRSMLCDLWERISERMGDQPAVLEAKTFLTCP